MSNITTQQIITDFQNYINSNSNIYNNWYVGITSNINQRMFTEHNVKNNDIWIHAPADSNEIARSVEKYFLDLGCDGNTGGGDISSTTVYVYKKNPHTKP